MEDDVLIDVRAAIEYQRSKARGEALTATAFVALALFFWATPGCAPRLARLVALAHLALGFRHGWRAGVAVHSVVVHKAVLAFVRKVGKRSN